MTSNIYGNMESAENNPFCYMRMGRILKVFDYDNIPLGGIIGDSNIPYLSVAIKWLDRGGTIGDDNSTLSKARLSYPHISQGWGLTYKPSLGDVVICGFRMEGYPVILAYQSVVLDSKVLQKYRPEQLKYYFRPLLAGEYSWKSKQGAEWYLDQKGSLHLLTRDQSKTENVETDPFTGIPEAVVKDNLDVEVTLGKVYNNAGKAKSELFTDEVLSKGGNSIKFQVKDHITGTKVIIDSVGNVEIAVVGNNTSEVSGDVSHSIEGNAAVSVAKNVNINVDGTLQINAKDNVTLALESGKKLEVTGGSAEIIGTSSLALKSDVQTLRDELNTFITSIYNAHVHPYVDSVGSPPVPTPSNTSATTSTGSSPTAPAGTQKLKGS